MRQVLVGKLELNTQRAMWVWLRIYLTGFNDTILKQKDTDKSYSSSLALKDFLFFLSWETSRSEDAGCGKKVAYKVNSHSFNLLRVYFNSLTLSKIGERFWSSIPRKFRHRLFTSSIKREITHFYVIVVQGRHSNVLKSVMHVQSCRFRQILRSLFSQFCFHLFIHSCM